MEGKWEKIKVRRVPVKQEESRVMQPVQVE